MITDHGRGGAIPRTAGGRRRVRFGDFVLDERSGELLCRGDVVHLTPQVWRLLELLVSRAGELVSREELRESLWPGETFVDFDLGLNHCVNRLRAALGETPESPRFLVTVPRRGYRFVGPVECVPSPGVLAVLPFANLSGDRGDEPLADGMCDTVTTALARSPSVRVLSRQSVLHLKGSERSLGEIGVELGADTLVEGATFRLGSLLRVTVQLVRVEPESHLWSGSFEGELGELFSLEETVARATLSAVETALRPIGPR